MFKNAVLRLLPDHASAADQNLVTPEALASAAGAAAAQPKYFNQTAWPLAWHGTGDLFWVHPQAGPRRMIYAFFPFWRGADKDLIDFSLFDRIGVVGAQLADNGAWYLPEVSDNNADWWATASELAKRAQSHGAHLDLVLQRSDWSGLCGRRASELRSVAELAARQAVQQLLDHPIERVYFRGLLGPVPDAPGWRMPSRVFDGVTVMFKAPARPQDGPAFMEFTPWFIRALIAEMQATKKHYALNIVIEGPSPPPTASLPYLGQNLTAPASRTGQAQTPYQAAFSPTMLMQYKHLAEPARQTPPLSQAEQSLYVGTTPIRVTFLVLLPDATTDTKKELRRQVDLLKDSNGENNFEGGARSTFLHSLVPIVTLPGDAALGAEADRMATEQRLNYDLDYYRQNFGGVGFWPVPTRPAAGAAGEPPVYAALHETYFRSDPPLGPLGRPWASLFTRLLWQAAATAVVVFLGLYFFWDASPRLRDVFIRGVIGAAGVVVALGAVLLLFDPALHDLKIGNWILGVVVAIAFVIVVWVRARPKIKDP
jgi:hypothetical protein